MTEPTTTDTRAAALLARIPDEEQAQFERYYQQRLAQALAEAQRGASHLGADPDAVERELLEQLIREAEGRDDPDGLGLVPTGDGEASVVPPDAEPGLAVAAGAGGARSSAAGGAATMSRGRIALGVVVALLPVVWLVFSIIKVATGGTARPAPTAAPAAAPAETATPLAELDSTQKVLVWYPASLELGGQVYRVVASPGKLGGTWSPETAPGVAAWLANTFINTVVCLPPGAADLHLAPGQAVLLRNAAGALRRYQVVAVQAVERQQVELLDQRRAGLTLIVCGAESAQRQVATAVYRPELPGAATAQELPGVGQLTLQRVATLTDTADLAGAGQGQQLVGVTVAISSTTGASPAPGDLAAQLQFADGTVAEPLRAEGDAVAPGATATWRFLVPATGGEATLRVQALTGQSARLPVALPTAPAPRIRAALTPADVRRSGGLLHLALLIETQGGPAVLAAGEVTLLAGEVALALDARSTPLPLLLAPGAPARLHLFAAVPAGTPTLELRVRGQRWRVRLPQMP